MGSQKLPSTSGLWMLPGVAGQVLPHQGHLWGGDSIGDPEKNGKVSLGKMWDSPGTETKLTENDNPKDTK